MDLRTATNKTFYELLGLPPEATPQQIREVYRELARVYHPDSNYYADIAPTKVSPEQIELFKIITAAYQTLIDPSKRKEYDAAVLPSQNSKLKNWEDAHDEFWKDQPATATQVGNRTRKMTFGQTGSKPFRGTMTNIRVEPTVTEIIKIRSKRRTRAVICISCGLLVGLAAVVGIIIGKAQQRGPKVIQKNAPQWSKVLE